MSDQEERAIFQQLISSFDSPAFVRRSRDVEAEWNAVISACRRQRDEWLEMPMLRVAQLHRALNGIRAFEGLITEVESEQLQGLYDEALRRGKGGREFEGIQTAARGSDGKDAPAVLRKLTESFRRFNRRWIGYLDEIDLSPLNRKRSDYNEYYILEKECAMISPSIARIGFQPLPAVTTDDLLREFPLLVVPRYRDATHSPTS